MVSQTRSSSRATPQKSNNPFEIDGAHGQQQAEEDATRTIHRSFAFDEWDNEKETMPNDAIEPNGGYPSECSINCREEIQDTAVAVAAAAADVDDDLHRIIRRTFAFDEWDDGDFIMGLLVGHKHDERRDKYDLSSVSFMPIKNDIDSCVIMGNSDASTTTSKDDVAADITNLWNTKFDLGNQQHTSTTVSPSPASKSKSKKKRNQIQRPFPLYSQHQIVEPSALSSDSARTPPISWHESFTTSSNGDTNRRPEDYKYLEQMFQHQVLPDCSEPFPPQCQSVPRRASAFRCVVPTDTATTAMITPEPNRNRFSSPERNESSNDSSWADGRTWLDQHLGSGINLFRDDDEVFDSPTSTSEDSVLSSTIPSFIMFHNNEWE